jgi:hypothetical protein
MCVDPKKTTCEEPTARFPHRGRGLFHISGLSGRRLSAFSSSTSYSPGRCTRSSPPSKAPNSEADMGVRVSSGGRTKRCALLRSTASVVEDDGVPLRLRVRERLIGGAWSCAGLSARGRCSPVARSFMYEGRAFSYPVLHARHNGWVVVTLGDYCVASYVVIRAAEIRSRESAGGCARRLSTVAVVRWGIPGRADAGYEGSVALRLSGVS